MPMGHVVVRLVSEFLHMQASLGKFYFLVWFPFVLCSCYNLDNGPLEWDFVCFLVVHVGLGVLRPMSSTVCRLWELHGKYWISSVCFRELRRPLHVVGGGKVGTQFWCYGCWREEVLLCLLQGLEDTKHVPVLREGGVSW